MNIKTKNLYYGGIYMIKNNIIEQNREETNQILIKHLGKTIEELQMLSNDELISLLKTKKHKEEKHTPNKPIKKKRQKNENIVFDNKKSIIVDSEIKKFKDEAQSCKIKGGKIFFGDTLSLALFGATNNQKNNQKLLLKQLKI